MAQPVALPSPVARHFDATPWEAGTEVTASGISWAAVLAGAVAAAALSLILLALGTGVGLSAISPWSGATDSVSKIGTTAICWLVATQILASAMGGYLAGRLRTKWVTVHTHEVYFRDTAHGFLVWAVGLVVTAAFLATAATAMVGGMTRFGASASSAADPNAYFVDALFRSDRPAADRSSVPERTEVGGVLAYGLRHDGISAADKAYLSGLVAARTGLSQADADKRVSDIWEQVLQSAETARRAMAHLSYWTFLALLVGAFSASLAATLGGKERDHVVHV
jgi:hypothetical protein